MVLTVVDQVIATLRSAGFKTHRAYPGTAIPVLTQVVAAVQIGEADFAAKRIALEVMLLGPQSLGAEACEDAAITAAQALENKGFSCTVGSSSFDGSAGFYCVSCIASKQQESIATVTFKLGTIVQNWVVSFTAKQQVDEVYDNLATAPWTVRLEQFFPTGTTEDVDPEEEPYHLVSGRETYTSCVWKSCERRIEPGGIRQIREGIAEHRII